MNRVELINECYWVGVGASAGGLTYLQEFCKKLKQNSNFIYIIAQHLSPKHDSMLHELIQRETSLKVVIAKNNLTPLPGTIYITPPKKDIYVENSKIMLVSSSDDISPSPNINDFFVSLAENLQERAVGIIFSGTGSDGALGVKAIRASGGLTLVQSPDESKYDGMPQASIDTNCVDHILKTSEIAEFISKFSLMLSEDKKQYMANLEKTSSFDALINILHDKTGVSFKQYKKGTLKRRIERRMIANTIKSFDDYVEFLKKDTEEVHHLYKDILISVTNFFRDSSSFNALKEEISDIVRTQAGQKNIRVWSIGCATGEEPFSLAILFAEVLGGVNKLYEQNIQIFATDIDKDALNVARKGFYPKATLDGVPDAIKEKYFIESQNGYSVIKPIKDIVLFANHNIIDDPPFLRINLVTCRNLLIYFDQDLQKKIYKIFHYSLRDKGILFLGKSESTSRLTNLFRTVDPKFKIYQKRDGVQAHLVHNYSKASLTTRKINESTSDKFRVDRQLISYESLIGQLGDAGIIVDENLNINQVFGDATPFLKVANSKPEWNLGDLIADNFKHEIKALAFKSLKSNTRIQGQYRNIKIEGDIYECRLNIYPLQNHDNIEKFLLVSFEKSSVIELDKESAVDDETLKYKNLQDELTTAREHLQTVIEELETSNEELQSTNEELQSSNEELQSSNEELETTNEELQSANEELVTVNEELNTKTFELEKTSSELFNIKNSLSFPLILCSKDLKIIRSNELASIFFAVQRIEGRDLLKLVGKKFDEIEVESKIIESIRSEKTVKIQLQSKQAFYWLHITPYIEKGEVDGVILSFIENTEFVEQEINLKKSQLKSEAANQAKADFLANISHEIRTPLNAICSIPDMLIEHKDSQNNEKSKKEYLDLLNILKNSSLNLKHLVDELLDFSKLESGSVKLENRNFSIKKVLNEVIDLYSIKASEKDIKLSTEISHLVPEMVMGDKTRVKQVLNNLVSNAIKFTQKGEVLVSIECEDKKGHKDFHIKVKDEGIGIDKDELESIFNKFSQADNTISRKYGGTGLGLAIVKEIVDLMDGSINVKSRRKKGTTFHITLPLRNASSKKKAQSDNKLKKDTILFNDVEKAKESPILIVEDNDANLFIMKMYLEKLGCYYDIARSGEEAIKRLQNKKYSVVLLDIQMGEVSGFDVVEKLHQSTNKENLPVFMAVSAHVHKSIKTKAKELGIQKFISKPVELYELYEALKLAFNLRSD